MLYYVTGNQNKIDIAKKFLNPFGIIFESKNLDVIEIQSNSVQEIAIYKAKEAYSKLKKPLFVSDHFWSIPSLGGFPGAYMKYINDWLTPDDILNLMKTKKNREIILTDALCYIDKSTIKIFEMSHKGKILNKSLGKGLPGQTIVSLSRDGKSIAQKLEKNPSALEEGINWENFAKWYKNYAE